MIYLYRVREQIGYKRAYSYGLTGAGIGIGVLDSGIYSHMDLAGRLVIFRDFINGKKENYDDFGHGTHICGIIAGSGRASKGRYQGLAPKCRLYVGKVLDEKGNGTLTEMIRGMEWLLSIAKQENIRLINISISSVFFQNKYNETRLLELFRMAYERGILVIVAAGNKGPKASTISRLGDTMHTICVGCHDGIYYAKNPSSCEKHSGQGPGERVYLKPDLVAPGTNIVSCKNQQAQYTTKSGTSMAAPIVTASLALLLEYKPGYSVYDMKRKLLHSLDDLGESYLKQGFGMVNIDKLLDNC